ncbi:OsmC family protein [Micromonospora sp. NPDC005299]|uniref:OsmC family protein n=1 Tax=Micromonospora sp. NPDC005299 TaxID=3364231 RepID=UPI0036CA450A
MSIQPQAEPGRTSIGASVVSVTSAPGRAKIVTLPVTPEPVQMGVHGPVADHYKIPEGTFTPLATTLDYVVGATVACLTGTFGGRLAAVGQSTTDGELQADGEGELVAERGVIRIRSIQIRYRLRLSQGVDEAAVRRAHETHTRFCPVAQSIGGCVEITTQLELVT